MLREPLPRHRLPRSAGSAVIAVGIDGNTPTRCELPPHLDVLRVHQGDEILHDGVDAVLMEIPMVAKAEEVELQALRLHHAHIGHIGDVDGGEIRLAGYGAEAGEFGTVELDEVVIVLMLVLEGLQHPRIIICGVFRLLVP